MHPPYKYLEEDLLAKTLDLLLHYVEEDAKPRTLGNQIPRAKPNS